jgi:hypothetical protein
MSEFVGAGHLQLVNHLVTAFNDVCAGKVRVEVLRAPTGIGKTRVIQEFYARIAAAQQGQKYWPPRLESEGPWLQSRKQIFPRHVAPMEGAEIPWVWWGLSCTQRSDGSTSHPLFEHASQLYAHAGTLFNQTSRSRIGRSVDGATALVTVLGILGITLSAPVALPVTFAGLARTAWDNGDLIRQITAWRERRRKPPQLSIDSSFSSPESYPDELADHVCTVSQSIPVIVVVDDAQWANESLIKFVNALTNSNGRVLVVASTWPTANKFNTLLERRSSSSRITIHDLRPPTDTELEGLISDEYQLLAGQDSKPNPDLVRAIIRKVGNSPMGVRAIFAIERTSRLVKSGRFDAESLEAIPRDLDDILRLYWNELPENVQRTLALAALAGMQFPAEPVAEAAESIGFSNPYGQLNQAAQLHGYIQSDTALVWSFTDPLQLMRQTTTSRSTTYKFFMTNLLVMQSHWSNRQKKQS